MNGQNSSMTITKLTIEPGAMSLDDLQAIHRGELAGQPLRAGDVLVCE